MRRNLYISLSSFLALVLLLLALPWNAVKAQDSWEEDLQSMLNRRNVLVQQVQEKQRLWLEHPSLDNELQYISMRNKLEHFSQTVANAAKSIKEARDANAVIWQTYTKTTDDIAKMLSTVFWAIVPDTTWLLGASDEDLYGPNWRWAEEKFKGIQAEARSIRDEIQKLKDDPANAEKVAQLKARAQQVKQKMDTLRKVYRAEQQNLGTANIFWGDTMGRGIEACMESFKFSDLLGQFLDANVKYIFDVIKPMVLQQFGYKYVAAASRPSNILVGGSSGANDPYKDGMTMNMADELTGAILGADGDISEFKKALDIGMGKVVKDVMVKEFLSKELQKDLGKVMEEQLLQWSLNAPFDRIPTDFTSQTLNSVIADQAFKSDLTRKMQQTWIPNAKEGLNKKMEIFAEDRLDHLMAWGPDIIDLWCKRTMYNETMSNAAKLAESWRKDFRAKVAAKELDADEFRGGPDVYANPEDNYVNIKWNNFDLGQVIAGKGKEPAKRKTGRELRAKTEDKVEQVEEQKEPSLSNLDEIVAALRDAADKVRSNSMTPQDFLQVRGNLEQIAWDVICKKRTKIQDNINWLYRSHYDNKHPWTEKVYTGTVDGVAQYKYVYHAWWLAPDDPCLGPYRSYVREDQELTEKAQDYGKKSWDIISALYDESRALFQEFIPLFRAREQLFKETLAETNYPYISYISWDRGIDTWVDSPWCKAYAVQLETDKTYPGYPGTLETLPPDWNGPYVPLDLTKCTIPDMENSAAAMERTLTKLTQAKSFYDREHTQMLELTQKFEDGLDAIADQVSAKYYPNQALADFSFTYYGSCWNPYWWTRDLGYSVGSTIGGILSTWEGQKRWLKGRDSTLFLYEPEYAALRLTQLQDGIQAYRDIIAANRKFENQLKTLLPQIKDNEQAYSDFEAGDRQLKGKIWNFCWSWQIYAKTWLAGAPFKPSPDWGDAKTLRKQVAAWMAALDAQVTGALPDAVKSAQKIGLELNALKTDLAKKSGAWCSAAGALSSYYQTYQFNSSYYPGGWCNYPPLAGALFAPIKEVELLTWRIPYYYENAQGGSETIADSLRGCLRIIREWEARDQELESKLKDFKAQITGIKSLISGLADGNLESSGTQYWELKTAAEKSYQELNQFVMPYNADTALLKEKAQLGQEWEALHPAWVAAYSRLMAVRNQREAEAAAQRNKEREAQRAIAPELAELAISRKPVEGYERTLELNPSDLSGGKLKITGKATSEGLPLTKVEISIDGGNTWNDAKGINPFAWEFTPEPEALNSLSVALVTEEGARYRSNYGKFRYSPFTPQQVAQEVLDSLSQAYSAEDRRGILATLSEDLSSAQGDYTQIDDNLRAELKGYQDIGLSFSDIATTLTPKGQIVTGANWRKSGLAASASSAQSWSGRATLRLSKESRGWRIVTLAGDNFLGDLAPSGASAGSGTGASAATAKLPGGRISIPTGSGFSFATGALIAGSGATFATDGDMVFGFGELIAPNGGIKPMDMGELNEFTAAPDSGYMPQVFNLEPGNVYMVETSSGKYAKFKVLEIKFGEKLTIQWVYQPNGSTSIPGP